MACGVWGVVYGVKFFFQFPSGGSIVKVECYEERVESSKLNIVESALGRDGLNDFPSSLWPAINLEFLLGYQQCVLIQHFSALILFLVVSERDSATRMRTPRSVGRE